jgi:hypothetical protein
MFPARLISKLVEFTIFEVAETRAGEVAHRRESARRLFEYYNALNECEVLCTDAGRTLRRLKPAPRQKYVETLYVEEWDASRLEFISERLAELTGLLVGHLEDDLSSKMTATGADRMGVIQALQIFDRALAEFIEAAYAQEMQAAWPAAQLARLFIWEDQNARRLRLAVPLLSEPGSWWDFYRSRPGKRVLPNRSRKIESLDDVAELASTFDDIVLKIRQSTESIASFLRANFKIEEIL